MTDAQVYVDPAISQALRNSTISHEAAIACMALPIKYSALLPHKPRKARLRSGLKREAEASAGIVPTRAATE